MPTDSAARHQVRAAMHDGTGADYHVVANRGAGVNIGIGGDLRRRADVRQGADADVCTSAGRMEMQHDLRERGVDVVHLNGRPIGRKRPRHNNGPRLRCGPACGPYRRNPTA